MIGKNKLRWLALLLSVATVINLLPLTIGATNKVTAAETEPSDGSTDTDTITGSDNGDGTWTGSYLSYNEESGKLERQTTTAEIFAPEKLINSNLTSGWYVVLGEESYTSSIKISGDVHLILAEGAILYATEFGIDLSDGNSLTFYAQSLPQYKDDGSLDTEKTTTGKICAGDAYNANFGIPGIGVNTYSDSVICGTLTINGGIIEAAGSRNAPGIGGSQSVGKITINGGYVDAKGFYEPAIGTLFGCESGDYLTINGGTVIADALTHSDWGISPTCIGCDSPYCSSSFPVTINGFDFIRLIGASTVFMEAPTVNSDFNFRVRVGNDLDHLTDLEKSDVTSSIYTEYNAIEMIQCMSHVTIDVPGDNNDPETHISTCKWCGNVASDTPHSFNPFSGLCSCGLWKGEYLEYNFDTMSVSTKVGVATVLTGNETELTDGATYVAIGDVELCSPTFELSDTAEIILADGATLRFKGSDGSQTQILAKKLVISAQSTPLCDAGGVVSNNNKAGTLIIDGCCITDELYIYGGIVKLSGSSAYIEADDVIMSGGMLDVVGNSSSAVINANVSIYENAYIKAHNLNETKTAAFGGSVNFAEKLRICVTGDEGRVLPGDRESVISTDSLVTIEPCTDATHETDVTDENDNHVLTCKWCGSSFAIHVFDNESNLCSCGLWGGDYLEYNSKTKQYETKTATATVITKDMTELTEGWYVAIGKVFSSISSVSGDVHIILTDGSHLYTSSIQMEDNSNLHIYGQSTPIFDEYGDIDSSSKTGVLEPLSEHESLKGSNCTLTVDSGVVLMAALPEVNTIQISSVTVNGGYLYAYGCEDASAIVANVTIYGGRLFAKGNIYGVNGQVRVNDFDYIEIMGNSQAVMGTVFIFEGLHVRIASVDNYDPTYFLFEDFEDYELYDYATWLTFEHCPHDLSLKYKDADVHNESCKWCGLDRDVAHDFDEETSICDCGAWSGSYLEYNSKTKQYETKTATATVITEDMSKLTEGWYVAIGNIFSNISSISGDVHIILTDGSHLYTGSIQMEDSSNLHIYGQSTPIFDEYGFLDDEKCKTGVLDPLSDQESLKGSNCTLTVDSGVAWMETYRYNTIQISSVTVNGGYLYAYTAGNVSAIVANVTINGGRLFANAEKYGVNGQVRVNDFDYIEIMGNSQAVMGTVFIFEGLHVRIASVDNYDPTYFLFEDFEDYELYDYATWLTFEHCPHDLSLKYKDADVHNESCKWCGLDRDVAHDFDEETSICDCGKSGISTRVIGYTLTLDGKIGVNFYMKLTDEIAGSETAYMHFVLPDGSTCDVPVSDAKERVIDGKTYYVFSCYVAAYEMTGNICAQIKEGELSGTLYSFTIREYAEYIIDNPTDYTEGDVAFAKALLNYGAAAQTYFKVETDDLANKDLSDADKKITELTADDLASFAKEPTSKEGIGTFIGFNLALGSETSLRAYFELWSDVKISDVIFTINGTQVKAERVGDYYRIAANNIKAFELDNDITFAATVGDEVLTFECSAMSYCHSILNIETSEDYPATLKTLISAIRAYQLASEIYN